MLGQLENNNKKKKKKKNAKWRFFTSRSAHVNCTIMVLLYTHYIGNLPQNPVVVFKMRDSVPSTRYSPICNVLRQWKTSLTRIYRVYQLYNIQALFVFMFGGVTLIIATCRQMWYSTLFCTMHIYPAILNTTITSLN